MTKTFSLIKNMVNMNYKYVQKYGTMTSNDYSNNKSYLKTKVRIPHVQSKKGPDCSRQAEW